MTLAPFDHACASCHSAEISGSAQVEGTGLVVFALPSLDVESLRSRGMEIGQWPADAAYSETPLPRIMRLILSADPDTAYDLTVASELDLLDLSTANPEQLAAVTQLAWAIKRLLLDVALRGQVALRERLAPIVASLGDTGNAALGQISGEVVRSALGEWLPGLAAELAAGGGGPGRSSEVAPADLDDDLRREASVAAGGWYWWGIDYTIRYRPAGHADSFLRAWLDLAAKAEPPSQRRALHSIFRQLSEPNAIGACAKCHSVDRTHSGARIHWSSRRGQRDPASLTRFRHQTHFPALGDAGCLTCHEPELGDGAHLAAFDPMDPESDLPDFRPMTLSTCAQCHSGAGAPVRCLTCHTYHTQGTALLPEAPLQVP